MTNEMTMDMQAVEPAVEAQDPATDFAAREEALRLREMALERRELRAWAEEALREKGLPEKLAELLPCDSRQACEAALELMASVIGEAIRQGVEARIAACRAGINRTNAAESALTARVRGAMGLKD